MIEKTDILEYDNVPVRIAAQYLGVSDQAIRWGIRSGIYKFGVPLKSRCQISPHKLIAQKETLDESEKISIELKTIAKFIDKKLITFDDILGLVCSKETTQ